MREKLTSGSILWMLLVVCVAMLLAMGMVADSWGLQLLDGLYSADEARAVVSQMSSEQKAVHAWLTGTLDVLYPLLFGALLCGVALRFFPKQGSYLALPVLAGVLMDLVENVVQILALTGTYDLLAAKAFVTPAKMVFFIVAMLIAAAALVRWAVAKIRPAAQERGNAG